MVETSCRSGRRREAERHLARISPWLRCEPKIQSSGSRLAHCPTEAASWPMERWAGPLWLYSMPFQEPWILMELSIDSNSRMVTMSSQIRFRPSAPNRASSALMSLRYWLSGIRGTSTVAGFRTALGFTTIDLGMMRFLSVTRAPRPRRERPRRPSGVGRRSP
jgi:hypothetical protein